MDDQGRQPPDSGGEQVKKYSPLWMACGVVAGILIGAVIGILTDNLRLWIGVGVAIGAGLGVAFALAASDMTGSRARSGRGEPDQRRSDPGRRPSDPDAPGPPAPPQ